MEKEINEQVGESEKFRVTQLLKKHGIDTSSWGSGKAKTINHLMSEILSGESQLLETENGELLRVLEVADGTITFIDASGVIYKLTEDRQEFKDGRIRKRDHLKDISLAEKVLPGEDPKDALVRGINEELGIIGELQIYGEPVLEEKWAESHSFPGLNTQYKVHKFNLTIRADSFNPDGYKEEQPDKTTYFVWEEVTTAPHNKRT